jgi:hypothetical protein
MRMPRAPGQADEAIAREASRLSGLVVSPRQTERWREAGYLSPLERHGRGRGRGSRSEYPEGTTEHAACLASALEQTRYLDEAALVCFVRGFSLSEAALRKAYRASFERLTTLMERAAPSTEPWDIAETIGRLFARRASSSSSGRRMTARLVEAGKQAQMADVATNLVATALGVAEPQRLTFESLNAMGPYRDTARGIGPMLEGPPEPSFAGLAEEVSLERLTETALGATLQALERGRDDVKLWRSFSAAFAATATRSLGVDFGFAMLAEVLADDFACALVGIPLMVIMRRSHWTEEASALFSMMEEQTPVFEARARLVGSLSEFHARLLGLGAEGVAMLPEAEREAFGNAIRAWMEAHPEDAPLLMNQDG